MVTPIAIDAIIIENGKGPMWDAWMANATHSAVQINMRDIPDSTKITVGTNEMSRT